MGFKCQNTQKVVSRVAVSASWPTFSFFSERNLLSFMAQHKPRGHREPL